MFNRFKKTVENNITLFESRQAFANHWYSIIFNPFFIARHYLRKHINSFAKEMGSGKSILDVGCGNKPYQDLFQGNSYQGIDVKGGGLADETKMVDMYFDGKTIPFPSKSYDVIICSQVFEHVEYLDQLTEEIFRVLKDDGQLLITMPFVWPEHGLPYDFRRFTLNGHKQHLSKHGFINIQTSSTCGIFATCGQLLSDFFINALQQQLSKVSSKGAGHKVKFILHRLTILLVCFPIQLIFFLLDSLFMRKGITLDYVVTADKTINDRTSI